MRRIATFFLAAWALNAIFVVANAQETLFWQPTLDTAQRAAAQTGRLVLVYFHADWCQACRAIEQQVFVQPAVAADIQTYFVPVKVHADHFPATARQYGVSALPTLVAMTPDGQALDVIQGRMEAGPLVARLNQVALAARRQQPPSGGAMLARSAPADYPAGPVAPAPAAPAAPDYRAWTASSPAVSQPPAAHHAAMQPYPSQPPYGDDRYGSGATAPPPAQTAAPPSPYSSPPSAAPVASQGMPPGAAPQPYSPPPFPGGSPSPYAAAAPSPYVSAPPSPYATAPPSPYGSPPGGIDDRRVAPPASATWPTAAPMSPPPSVAAPSMAAASAPAAPPGAGMPPTAAAGPSGGWAASNHATPSEAGIAPQNPPLGLEGYCPVTLAEKKQWVAGDRAWGAIHRGRTYLFAGPEEQRKFLAGDQADRYAPVLGGHDVVRAVEQGQMLPGQRRHGLFFEGKVYLFADEAALERFSLNAHHYASQAMQATAAAPTQHRYW